MRGIVAEELEEKKLAHILGDCYNDSLKPRMKEYAPRKIFPTLAQAMHHFLNTVNSH